MKVNQYIIGICGVSQSGKSTLSKQLQHAFSTSSVEVLELDEFVNPEESIPKIADRINWEDPASMNWTLVLDKIRKSKAQIIIIEGIFSFHETLLPMLSLKILVEVDEETFLKRRRNDKRWGEEPEWYLKHVWKSNQWLINSVDPDYKLKGVGTHELSSIIEVAKLAMKEKSVLS